MTTAATPDDGSAPTLMLSADPTEARERLATYLRDHRAAASAGLAFVRRCRRDSEGTELSGVLATLVADVAADRQSLDQVMERLEVSPSRVKAVTGWSTSNVGHLVHRLQRSPLRRVVELDALVSAVSGKEGLWRALDAIADTVPELDHDELQRLIGRAVDQRQQLQDQQAKASVAAFTAT